MSCCFWCLTFTSALYIYEPPEKLWKKSFCVCLLGAFEQNSCFVIGSKNILIISIKLLWKFCVHYWFCILCFFFFFCFYFVFFFTFNHKGDFKQSPSVWEFHLPIRFCKTEIAYIWVFQQALSFLLTLSFLLHIPSDDVLMFVRRCLHHIFPLFQTFTKVYVFPPESCKTRVQKVKREKKHETSETKLHQKG